MGDEKLSDMSFTLNFKEIIGSIDEKTEMEKMKMELQEKDDYIQFLLKRLEEQDHKLHNKSGDPTITTNTKNETKSQNNSLLYGNNNITT